MAAAEDHLAGHLAGHLAVTTKMMMMTDHLLLLEGGSEVYLLIQRARTHHLDRHLADQDLVGGSLLDMTSRLHQGLPRSLCHQHLLSKASPAPAANWMQCQH